MRSFGIDTFFGIDACASVSDLDDDGADGDSGMPPAVGLRFDVAPSDFLAFLGEVGVADASASGWPSWSLGLSLDLASSCSCAFPGDAAAAFLFVPFALGVTTAVVVVVDPVLALRLVGGMTMICCSRVPNSRRESM